MASPATIVHDPSEAVPLCPALGLYLKPIARVSISVALPAPRPGPVSTWEVMERLKALVAGGGGGGGAGGGGGGAGGGGAGPAVGGGAATPRAQFSALRIARCTPDLVRFEGELENRALARACLARLDGQSIRLGGGGGGCGDALRVRAHAELPRSGGNNNHHHHQDGGDAPPGAEEAEDGAGNERPDTLHLQGLPCRWFADRGATPDAPGGATTAITAPGGGNSDRPSEAALRQAFGAFGAIRRVDIPMLDPYRGEATVAAAAGGGGGGGGGAGQLPQFEAYVQYRDPAGVARALAALRGNRLMFRGEDGKAVACGIKVTSDATQHLSEAAVRRRQQERQKLQELERQREAQKRREKEAEARRRAEERRQQEAEAQARARRREEKLRRREQRARARASRRHRRRAEREAEREAQRRLRGRVRREERRLLLAQRALQAVRLVAELLARAKAARLRRLQEAELRRVEQEKERALGLQRRERELRRRLLALLLGRGDPAGGNGGNNAQGHAPAPAGHAHPDNPGGPASALLDILHRVSRRAGSGSGSRPLPGPGETPGDPAGDPETPGGGAEEEPAAVAPLTSPIAPVTSPIAPVTSPIAPVTSPIAPATSSAAPAAPPTDPGDPGGDPDPPSRRRRSDKDRDRDRDRDRKRGRRHHHQPHPHPYPHRGDRDPSTRSRSRSPLPRHRR